MSAEASGQSDREELYELEPPPRRPDLHGEVVVRSDVDELIDALAADLVIHALNCVREFGDFHLALSAGPAFDRLYTRLMFDPNYRQLPWRRTHLWFVTECCVPYDDERSSFRMISEIVGDHADIPPEQFHPMAPESPAAVEDYESLLKEALGWREKGQDRLDYVLLAMDASGATAGLTPEVSSSNGVAGHTSEDRGRLVCRRPVPGGPDRISMTLSFLNAARFVAVFAAGAELGPAMRQLPRATVEEMPLRGLKPINGELRWYLDGPACDAALEE